MVSMEFVKVLWSHGRGRNFVVSVKKKDRWTSQCKWGIEKVRIISKAQEMLALSHQTFVYRDKNTGNADHPVVKSEK